MCGRFTRSRPIEEYAEYFQAAPTQASSPSYNVCPSDDILAVVAESDQSRHLTWFRWGIRLRSGEPMAMAGLWDQWEAKDGSQSISSATIITITANALIQSIHDRMSVIVPMDNAQSWLDPGLTDTRKLAEYLKPIEAEALEAWPVSPQVNSPTHQGPDLIKPL